jgi:hypothetical protein
LANRFFDSLVCLILSEHFSRLRVQFAREFGAISETSKDYLRLDNDFRLKGCKLSGVAGAPQTLNLYSMVSDDPESFADLDGHDCCDFWQN